MSEMLFDASKNGDAAKVKALIEAGADVHAVDERGWTALFMACHNPELNRGFPDVVEALIAAGADFEKCIGYGMRPLMIAAGYGEAGVVDVLIKAGAKIKAENEGGRTAMQMATDKNYVEVVNLLWEAQMLSGDVGTCGSTKTVNFVKFENRQT